MNPNEIEKLENLNKLITRYFNSGNIVSDVYTPKININYYEVGFVITNLIKMCILTLNNDGHTWSSTNKKPVDVALVLEMVLEMFPLNEFELLADINQLFVDDK